MSDINCESASKHWDNEINYLKTIEYVAITKDNNISLLCDEEGNSETILTPKSARWLAEKLVEYADIIDRDKLKKSKK